MASAWPLVAGAGGAAGGVLALEVGVPLLLLCWLCCWPSDDHSESSSTGKPPRKPILVNENGSRRRSSDAMSRLWPRRGGSSAASMHLPSTSGQSRASLLPSPPHRSHDDLPRRSLDRCAFLCAGAAAGGNGQGEDGRYHSAPSVIDEVLHRRDWERSTKELYIPLKPDIQVQMDSDDSDPDSEPSNGDHGPTAPRAQAESSSIEDRIGEVFRLVERPVDKPVACKKHHTNIKSSKHKKEQLNADVKDTDATDVTTFIDDVTITNDNVSNDVAGARLAEAAAKRVSDNDVMNDDFSKDAKQSYNEAIKGLERTETGMHLSQGFRLHLFDMDLDDLSPEPDRSGARHCVCASHRASLATSLATSLDADGTPASPPAFEGLYCDYCTLPVGYIALMDGNVASRYGNVALPAGNSVLLSGNARSRHASDGAILNAPAPRPESGAFSESAVELEVLATTAEDLPPPYQQLANPHTPDTNATTTATTVTTTAAGRRKETAI